MVNKMDFGLKNYYGETLLCENSINIGVKL